MFGHPAWAVGSCSSGRQLPEKSELSNREVLTILMGHPVPRSDVILPSGSVITIALLSMVSVGIWQGLSQDLDLSGSSPLIMSTWIKSSGRGPTLGGFPVFPR